MRLYPLRGEHPCRRPPCFSLHPRDGDCQGRAAKDGWNSRDPQRVSLAYAPESRWRNRDQFVTGREQLVAFLTAKWARELDDRLIKELWASDDTHIAVRFAYESHNAEGQWFRSYGNENWEFAAAALMAVRHASINDLAIPAASRLHWPSGGRPDDYPSLTDEASDAGVLAGRAPCAGGGHFVTCMPISTG